MTLNITGGLKELFSFLLSWAVCVHTKSWACTQLWGGVCSFSTSIGRWLIYPYCLVNHTYNFFKHQPVWPMWTIHFQALEQAGKREGLVWLPAGEWNLQRIRCKKGKPTQRTHSIWASKKNMLQLPVWFLTQVYISVNGECSQNENKQAIEVGGRSETSICAASCTAIRLSWPVPSA